MNMNANMNTKNTTRRAGLAVLTACLVLSSISLHSSPRLPLQAAPALAQTSGDSPPERLIIATIPPLHSLVQGVLGDTARARLLITGSLSPHQFSLRPSQVRQLQAAEVVFYIDDRFETPLRSALQSLPARVKRAAITSAAGLTMLPIRTGGAWGDHAHDHGHDAHGDGHDDHDTHGGRHDDHDSHGDGHDDHDAHGDGHDDHDSHGDGHDDHDTHGDGHDDHDSHGDGHDDHDTHGGRHDAHGDGHDAHDAHESHAPTNNVRRDLHLWLSPHNAKVIARYIARVMSSLHPAHQADYAANTAALLKRLDAMDERLKQRLAPVRGAPFIVFHDAYQYFERHYGLTAAGTILLDPHIQPSPGHIQKIRERIKADRVVCVFREPQLSDRLIQTVIEGSPVKSATLDPLGAVLPPGDGLYFHLLDNLAASLVDCLAG